MRVVLDSTAYVDILRQVPQARVFLERLDEPPLASEVTRAEVLRGVRSAERYAAEGLFARTEWIPVDESIARHAGDLGRRYARSHRGIGAADLIVAATAKHLEARLITSNVKHFPMFPRLKAPY